METKNKTLKVVLVQFEPKYKDIKYNISHLEQLLSKYSSQDNIDILIFPEMALSGYIFKDLEDIKPYASLYNEGIQYQFISNISKKLKCYSFCGYVEVTKEGKYYNSCFIITPEGVSLPSYHKKFLYTDDERWSEEGEEFGYMEIKNKKDQLIKVGLGICMDINPYKFKSPYNKMEFANHCLNKDVDVIVFPTNWLDNEPNDLSDKHIYDLWNYWLDRMKPFSQNKNLLGNKKVYLLAANRIGKEFESTFHGCSCILQITPQPQIMQGAGLKNESILEAVLYI